MWLGWDSHILIRGRPVDNALRKIEMFQWQEMLIVSGRYWCPRHGSIHEQTTDTCPTDWWFVHPEQCERGLRKHGRAVPHLPGKHPHWSMSLCKPWDRWSEAVVCPKIAGASSDVARHRKLSALAQRLSASRLGWIHNMKASFQRILLCSWHSKDHTLSTAGDGWWQEWSGLTFSRCQRVSPSSCQQS